MPTPRVFTIPPSAPFVPTLIRAFTEGTLVPGFPDTDDPLARARATLYLPTRRACRLARDIFLDATGERAAILPRIVAIGDIDEDEIAFAQEATGSLATAALELPPTIEGLERRLLLMQLVTKWADGIAPRGEGEAALIASNPASALALSDELARLMDDMTTREVSWDRFDQLVPASLDRYWQLSLEFLKIARSAWPALLKVRGAIEPAARRDALIRHETARLATHGDGPVIAAGSTGSMPATAELIATIARLPHGAVVLPGLDLALDEASWELIGGRSDVAEREPGVPAVGHPQFAMRALLHRIGITRQQVSVLGTRGRHDREHLASEALRPATATDHWQRLVGADARMRLAAALETMSVIEAANAGEEGLAIAVALREAVETPGKIAALVTPDRALARRVLAALERWKVPVDDSGGDALADTPAGTFARLAVEAALAACAPVRLLALLKHPLARLGGADGEQARTIEVLERAVLRGPRPQPGTAGLARAISALRSELEKLRRKERSDLHRSDPRADLSLADLDVAAGLVNRLAEAFRPFEPPREWSFAEIAGLHCNLIATLSSDETGAAAGFSGPDGEALAAAFEDVARHAVDAGFAVSGDDYADLFRTVISDRVIRRPGQPGVRVRIYGLLEARLQNVDRVILGSLVEGIWPPETHSDPWLSRPMRDALGLDLPERRISLSAHDFAQALGADEVILSYSAKLAGAPTVPSRFLQRTAAVAGVELWSRVRRNGRRYVAWAQTLDRPVTIKRIARPRPAPPRAARPTSLSVTEIESWLRDPYTVYARHILKLRELDPVDLPPGAADRGIMIHGALSEFTRRYEKDLPADPAQALVEIGARHFAALEGFAEARAFWWPRFQRIARWFDAWERRRRSGIVTLSAETSGTIELPAGERVFTLRGRADRIERLADGRYAILDYKTGQVPTDKQVRIGLSPQLTLEAAMLRSGGFQDLGTDGSVAALVYVALRGGEPPGEERMIGYDDGDADTLADRALGKLRTLVQRFERDEQPYLPLVLSMWRSRYGPYDHLARVKEWSVGGDEEEGGGGAE